MCDHFCETSGRMDRELQRNGDYAICAMEREIHNLIIDGIEEYELEIYLSINKRLQKLRSYGI